jgi:hypothetical protein
MAFICKMTDTAGVTGPVASGIYGKCETAAATAAKVVTLTDLDKLIVGCVIYVKFTNENTASSPTLNVNSLGAKAIRGYGSTIPGTAKVPSWYAGEIVGLMYDEITSGSTTTGYWYVVAQTHTVFTTTSVGSASAGTAFSIPNPSATDVTASKVTLGTAIPADDITAWSAGSLPALKWVNVSIPNVTSVGSVPTLKWVARSIPNVTGNTTVTIPNVTNVTDVTIPNVTGNSDVTFYGVDTINTVVTAATINEGVLTFSTGASITKTAQKTASKVTLGTAITASKVTLGTALSASKVTLGTAITASYLGSSSETSPSWSAGSTPTLGTAITASYLGESSETTASWSAGSLPSLSYTAKSIPNVTAATNVTASKVTFGTAFSVPNITVSSKTVVAPR